MIYVLVPAHDEAPTVGLLLWKVRQLFTSFNREYQLIVVNDGSTDATDETLAPYTRALPLTLLTHRKRQGYARSLEALLREAVRRTDRPRRDLAVTIQADFSESPEDLLELIKRLEGGADIVVADRRGAPASRIESLARRLLPALVKKSLGITGADDIVGTMRGYRLATIERLVKDSGPKPFLGYDGWAADVELLARAARYARKVESVVVNGARPPSARPSRRAPLREAWIAWRAARALRGLPMPQIAAGAAAEVVEPPVFARAPRVEAGRGERRGERPERKHNDRRQKQERRPRDEKRRQPERRAQGAAANAAPAAPPAPKPQAPAPTPALVEPGTGPTVAPDASAPGGAKRKRRRRGRGRRRGGPGRSPDAGQSPGEAAQAPPPPPAA